MPVDRPADGPADATDPPDAPDPTALAVLFTRALRRAGLAPATGSVVTFLQALGEVGISRSAVYWAGRSSLVHRPEDLVLYDQVFRAFWLGRAPMPARPDSVEELVVAFDDADDGHDDEGEDDASDGAE